MPHFTLGLDPSGAGPLLSANIGVSGPRAQALRDAGQPVPPNVAIRGLVDTGASGTCIDPTILHTLGLARSGQILCHTPSTGSAPALCDLYDGSLLIYAGANEPFLQYLTLPVMASDLLAGQGIHALIGRDVLAMCFFAYNGQNKQFTLGF